MIQGPQDPEGPSTQYVRTLVPKTHIALMVFGIGVLNNWVLGTWTLLGTSGTSYSTALQDASGVPTSDWAYLSGS